MKKINSPFELINKKLSLSGKNVVDVGCGTGDLVRALNEKGAIAVGIDTQKMLLKGGINPETEDKKFICGSAELLPFCNEFADIICYMASFHHIPSDNINLALEECKRVLKISGSTVFLEPVPQLGSYYELLKLVEDEREILALSYKAIKSLCNMSFILNTEEYFFMERSFSDYEKLLKIFVNDDTERSVILLKAKEITENLCKNSKINFEEYRFKSICRVNIFVKN
jgi:ubiquinone/menaquinone biosynthesis C-methylase UbiE